MASFDSTLIARLATGLYNTQIGNATMQEALNAVNGNAYGSVAALADALYARDFGSMSDADVATMLVNNVGVTGAAEVAEATAIVTSSLGAAAAGHKGTVVVNLLNAMAGLTAPAYQSAVTAFNAQVALAVSYAQTAGTADLPLDAPSATSFNLDSISSVAGLLAMHLTGNQDVRIDITNRANQVIGLDLDGDGRIAQDGVENRITGRAANFEAVDAYSRNPWNQGDTANNFLGDIRFDGTSYAGDGVTTNGNIFLGGLGADSVFSGVGNDFLAGGGVAESRVDAALAAWLAAGNSSATFAGVQDYLSGGRNADFFFAEFSGLDATDGSSLFVDAGNTADDNSAGVGQSAQDNDWLLFEASDDDEPVQIWLNDDNTNFQPDDGIDDDRGRVLSRSGESMLIDDIENVDASGNLYGFLDDLDVEIGGRAKDERDTAGADNYGIGSSAQLQIRGSDVSNIIIGGYDNDFIDGGDGGDLLMGGNMNRLNNPNLIGIVNDGRDELIGGGGADNIVFETDGGIYEGGATQSVNDAEVDTLWLTANSFGAETAADVTTDGTVRIDLAAGKEGGLNNSAGYGGADEAADTGRYTSDQTNYADGYARAQVQDFESVIATGLGGIDYDPDGDNESNVAHLNPQNFLAYMGDLDLRGTDGVNTLYAADGDDVIEGREGGTITYDADGVVVTDDSGSPTGDNRDKLSGGPGSDDFIFALGEDGGDGVDVIHRQTNLDVDGDGDVDNITDGTFGVDFGEEGPVISANSTFTISLPTGSTVNVAGISFLLNGTVYTINGLASPDFPTFTTALNTALDANPALAGLVAVRNADNTITITDPDGGTFAKNPAGGWVVTGSLPADGTSTWSQTVGAPTTTQDQDRLIYAAYEDRLDGELVDDDSTTGSAISLGIDSYAEDLVIDFNGGSTNIAEDQSYVLTFDNLTTEDTVTITVNNVQYTLTVGVDLDGNEIAAEELTTQGGAAGSQAAIQDAFLTRMAGFINSFMDDDTSAGEVAAGTNDGFATTLVLTQVDYNGEETVFMRTPTVTLTNGSTGEPARVLVTNNSQHEVQLLDFDGRNGKIDAANVLFIGNTEISRAILATGAGAAGTANTMAGSDSIIIDGGANTLQSVIFGSTTAIPNNTATNSFLRTDFTAHGDDLLLGGAANDTITASTGDDRVLGSLGTDTIDGGKSYYAVQVLGEPQARVYLLNQWEAQNPTKVAAISALTISSINRIGDAEDGNSTPVSVGTAEVYNDTLQFQQSDFVDNTNFTIALTGFTHSNSASTIEFRTGGSGTVTVDAAGNGTVDGTTTFTNFENIRTVSGTQTAVANGGQGNDTLDIALLSSVAAGVAYDLTNRADVAATATGAGKVTYSANAHASLTRPVETDFETLVIKVDGVENVITDNAAVISGDDLLIIDETEAAKNNTFTAGEGDDRIEYQNVFANEALDGSAEPRVTITLDNVAASVGGTDTVMMTSGRVGLTQAVDTLNAVEYITLAGNTAEGRVGDVDVVDVLDVRALTTGAVVNYGDGTVKNGGVTHVTIEGIVELETVTANGGNDVVMVADAAVMNTNARSDENNGTPNTNILFMTYRDFDDLNTAATTRKSFSAQVTDDTIQNVINQGQFTFNLSAEGGPVDVDRVDYSAELGRIVVPVGQGTATSPQYVVVDGDDDQAFSDAESRVDALLRVEEIVAAKGRSVLDFTAVGQDRQITFQYTAPTSNPADKAVLEQTIRIADGNGNTIAGLNAFVEKYTYDSPTSTLAAVADATWNQIEGSDARDIVIYNGSEDLVNQAGLDHRYTNDTLTLRGGNNEVRYSPIETSINAAITVTEENALTTNASEGLILATITFQNGTGAALPGGGTHTITSHTSDNTTAAGNLKIEGSQDAEDSVTFTATGNKTFILGTSPGVVNVNIGSLSSIVLTGFEFLLDPATNDVYDFSSLASTFGLTLTDNDDDHDTIKVGNDGIAFNTGTALTINLDAISSNADGGDADILPGFGFDFDVLDITRVTTSGLTLIGGSDLAPVETDADETADDTDEVVLGALSLVNSITGFEGMVLTQASTVAGTTFTFNPQLGTLTQGSTTVATSADVLSFGGTVFEGTNRASSVADATTGVTVMVAGTTAAQVYGGAGADTLVGAGGADRLQGNGGNDSYDGGTAAEVRTIQLDGILSATAQTVTITLDGNSYVLNEVAALVDVDADLGDDLDIIQGAGSDAVGAALAQLVTANLDELNATAAFGGTDLLTVAYNATTDLLTFTFATAVDVLATDTIVVDDTADGGTFAASSESVVTEGGSGGIDTFVFNTSLATNGQDTINNFVALGGAVDDVLDFQAFLGATVGGSVAGVVYDTVTSWLPDNVQLAVFANKASLAAADFALVATAGKLRMADGEKAVIVVTADVDGVSDAVNQAYSVYFVSNPATVAGLGDLTVELVGTIGSAVEMNLADFATAGTAT